MIDSEFQGDVAVVRMSHGKVNAMDRELLQALIERLEGVLFEGAAAVILRGNGRVFSAGIDLKRWLQEGPEYVLPFIDLLEELFLRVLKYPRPLIALIDGPAIAGGCMLAAAADCRLIASHASIGIPEMRIGVPLPMTAIEIVRMVARPQDFTRIVTRGATFAGAAAVEVGLADAVCEPESLLSEGLKVAAEFTAVPPQTFELTKRQIRQPVLRRIDAARREFLPEFQRLWCSQEIRDNIAAYVHTRLR